MTRIAALFAGIILLLSLTACDDLKSVMEARGVSKHSHSKPVLHSKPRPVTAVRNV